MTSHAARDWPVYTKDQFRDVRPELGQVYAVREPSGRVRGPYIITWVSWPSGAYRADPLTPAPPPATDPGTLG